MGKVPIKTRARMVGGVPMPRNGKAKANTARLGIVLPKLPRVNMAFSSHLTRVDMIPKSNPATNDIPNAIKVKDRCWASAVVNSNDLSIT